jgi:hypothetical protein
MTRPIDLPSIGSGTEACGFKKSAGGTTHNSKTAIVVDGGIGIIVVALRGTAIPSIVVPGAAPFGLPTPD